MTHSQISHGYNEHFTTPVSVELFFIKPMRNKLWCLPDNLIKLQIRVKSIVRTPKVRIRLFERRSRTAQGKCFAISLSDNANKKVVRIISTSSYLGHEKMECISHL